MSTPSLSPKNAGLAASLNATLSARSQLITSAENTRVAADALACATAANTVIGGACSDLPQGDILASVLAGYIGPLDMNTASSSTYTRVVTAVSDMFELIKPSGPYNHALNAGVAAAAYAQLLNSGQTLNLEGSAMSIAAAASAFALSVENNPATEGSGGGTVPSIECGQLLRGICSGYLAGATFDSQTPADYDKTVANIALIYTAAVAHIGAATYNVNAALAGFLQGVLTERRQPVSAGEVASLVSEAAYFAAEVATVTDTAAGQVTVIEQGHVLAQIIAAVMAGQAPLVGSSAGYSTICHTIGTIYQANKANISIPAA